MKPIITPKEVTVNLSVVLIRKSAITGLTILLLSFFSIQSARAHLVYAIRVGSPGYLVSFNSSSPFQNLSAVQITGVATGQILEGLDFRPATGQLYALGYNVSNGQAQVYTFKISTGAVTPVGSAITLAAGMTDLSFDFNPTVDRIRVTSRTRQNYRLNPNDGSLAATDGALTYAASPEPNAGKTPNVVTVAYSNSLATAASTTLYFYDFTLNTIGIINPPNSGTLNTVGISHVPASNTTGLDLDIVTDEATGVNTAYLSLDSAGFSNSFYSVNLSTGVATLIDAISVGGKITEIAVYIPPPVHNRIVYAAQAGNLITFNSTAPATILSSTPITGLGAGENISGMDFRPATGQLYALGSLSRLYTIDLTTAAATQVGANGAFTLSGTKFGFDFNPTVDRIRVVSDLDQNLRLNPNDGTLAATDGTLAFAAGDFNASTNPQAGAVAYTNAYPGATATTLYFYDYNLEILGIINPPNNGTLNTVGNSGINVFDQGLDMDIATDKASGTNTAYLSAIVTPGSSLFYRINLATGIPALVGTIGGGLPISAMAVYIPPPPPLKLVYGISSTGNLISFNSNAPRTLLSNIALTGITAGQVVEGLDFRPVSGQLYALGYNTSNGQTQLYIVNPVSGAATAVGTPLTLASNMIKLAVDFNPMVDRIRVVGSTGQNYRLNPNDGTLSATDTPLSYAPGDVRAGSLPEVHAAAYINNLAGAASTKLYYYDLRSDNFDSSGSPNTGVINTIGFSGINALSAINFNTAPNTANIDMDITTNQTTGVNTAFFTANTAGGATVFYIIDLATGEGRVIDTIPGILINEMAVSFPDVALPITLTNFSAKKSGTSTLLLWLTQNELNNQYYMLERSADGRIFAPVSDKINSKAVNGNSNMQLSYSFTDIAPLAGVNYYRLLQADKDGSIKYSQVLKVVFDGSFEISIYPNPVKKVLSIYGYLSQSTHLNVRLTDALGRTVILRDYKNLNGDLNIQLNMEYLQKGTYFLQILNGKNIILTQQVLKE